MRAHLAGCPHAGMALHADQQPSQQKYAFYIYSKKIAIHSKFIYKVFKNIFSKQGIQ